MHETARLVRELERSHVDLYFIRQNCTALCPLRRQGKKNLPIGHADLEKRSKSQTKRYKEAGEV